MGYPLPEKEQKLCPIFKPSSTCIYTCFTALKHVPFSRNFQVPKLSNIKVIGELASRLKYFIKKNSFLSETFLYLKSFNQQVPVSQNDEVLISGFRRACLLSVFVTTQMLH